MRSGGYSRVWRSGFVQTKHQKWWMLGRYEFGCFGMLMMFGCRFNIHIMFRWGFDSSSSLPFHTRGARSQRCTTGHGCVRQLSRLCPTTVTVVPVLQTLKITILWVLYPSICYLTDAGMPIKEIIQYRDPSIWKIDSPIPVKHIYIEARLYTPNFTLPQCVMMCVN